MAGGGPTTGDRYVTRYLNPAPSKVVQLASLCPMAPDAGSDQKLNGILKYNMPPMPLEPRDSPMGSSSS